MKKTTKKHIGTILLILLFLPLLIETVLIVDTIPVMQELEAYMSGDLPENFNIELMHFESGKSAKMDKPYFQLKRMYTLHNFKKGYILIYGCEGYIDQNGEKQINGYPIVKCNIERKNGKWEIVNVYGELQKLEPYFHWI